MSWTRAAVCLFAAAITLWSADARSQTYSNVTPGASGVSASTNDGNVPASAVDGSLATRWSANGDGHWLELDLGATRTVGYVRVAAYQGNTRQSRFDIQVATAPGAWTTVRSGAATAGTSTALETFDFDDVGARWVRYVGHGNTGSIPSWNSVTEIQVFAASDTNPPTATPTPTAPPRTTPTPTPVPGGFVHPGVINTRASLDFVKGRIAAGAQPWKRAYDELVAHPLASLSRNPRAYVTVQCGPYSDPNVGCSQERDDAAAAYANALLWAYTGNATRAQKAIQIMNAWSGTITGHTDHNEDLQTGWAGSNWTKAAEIIRHTGAGWASADITRFQNMLMNVYYAEISSGSGSNGNWELIMTDAIIGIGVFCNNRTVFNRGLELWRGRVPAYVYITSDGSAPKAPPGRSRPNWYGPSRYVEGLAQETCRDLGHTSYGLAAMSYTAETARIQGVDLYNEQSRRLRAGWEFNTRLQNGWSGDGLCTINRSFHETGEVAYNHFVNRLGLSLPNTLTFVNGKRPMGYDHHMVWETITHAQIGEP
jgi:hypothetical protein